MTKSEQATDFTSRVSTMYAIILRGNGVGSVDDTRLKVLSDVASRKELSWGGSVLQAEGAMGHTVALFAVLPGGSLFSFAEVADFELELEETVIPLARERAGGKRLEHRTLFLLRMGTVAEVAARRQRFNLGKSLLRSFTGNPDVELSHARRINDHATLWEERPLASLVRTSTVAWMSSP